MTVKSFIFRKRGFLSENLTEDESASQNSRRIVRYAAAAASVAVMAGAGLGVAQRYGQPKDTFDDPYLAYAELEKAFDKISAGINKSMDMANSVISEK